jgi:hypothetical protein
VESDERIQARAAMHRVCLALQPLLGRPVNAAVLARDGSRISDFDGELERVYELPWRPADELLVISVGAGSLQVRADEVLEVRRWSVPVFGRAYASLCVQLADGLSVLIQEDFTEAFLGLT